MTGNIRHGLGVLAVAGVLVLVGLLLPQDAAEITKGGALLIGLAGLVFLARGLLERPTSRD